MWLLCGLAGAAEPKWTVSVDPLTTAIGLLHVQVERRITPRVSVYGTPSVRVFDGILPDLNGPWTGIGIEGGIRGFFVGSAPEGGWVMWRGMVARTATEEPRHAVGVGGYTSVLVGYTGIVGPGLVLSGGLGISWFDYGILGYGVHGFAPAAHTSVGWAF
jgi:hypothetical protein